MEITKDVHFHRFGEKVRIVQFGKEFEGGMKVVGWGGAAFAKVEPVAQRVAVGRIGALANWALSAEASLALLPLDIWFLGAAQVEFAQERMQARIEASQAKDRAKAEQARLEAKNQEREATTKISVKRLKSAFGPG